MAYNGTHNLNAIHKTTFSSSVGASPVIAYMNAPVKGTLRKITGILRGAITTADGLITVTNVTSGVTIGTFAVTQSGSAAGQIFTLSPTYTNSLVAEDDVISLTPSLASGASIGMDFSLAFRTF